MDNPLIAHNSELEKSLEILPDQMADALLVWRKSTLEREKSEANSYLTYKGSEEKKSVEEIKALVKSDSFRYDAALKEAIAESEYERLYEKLMAAKHISSLRRAF